LPFAVQGIPDLAVIVIDKVTQPHSKAFASFDIFRLAKGVPSTEMKRDALIECLVDVRHQPE
jgi:hypothetical protein